MLQTALHVRFSFYHIKAKKWVLRLVSHSRQCLETKVLQTALHVSPGFLITLKAQR